MEPLQKKAKYETLIQKASKLYVDAKFNDASKLYNDALTLANELKIGKMPICVLKCMFCQCLLQSDLLDDLAEAVNILESLEKSLKNRFPFIYYLLAQAHCKLYRFDKALDALEQGFAVFKQNTLLETFYVPGTDIILDQNMHSDGWLKVKEECTNWHQPDAVCSSPDCNHISKPYVTPNKNIFVSDPAFNGMVSVNCNNKKRPCSLKFHPSCWKVQKDQMYPIEKVSDKDVLGNICFTPNCMNDEASPCIISSIDIIGPDNKVKAHITAPSSIWPIQKNPKSVTNKKVKVQPTKKSECPATSSIQYNPFTVKEEIRVDKHDNFFHGYDGNQILSIRYDTPEPDFSDKSFEVACERSFLFSLFFEYISNNLVRVCDAYSKFDEIKQDMPIKYIDILPFLLETNKFEVLDNSKSLDNPYFSQLQYNQLNDDMENLTIGHNEKIQKAQKYEDDACYYTDLMSDIDISSSSGEENDNTEDSKLNKNLHDDFKLNHSSYGITTHNSEAAGGDAQAYYNKKDEKINKSGDKNLCFSNDIEKRGTENRKLKEYINQLETEMNEISEENIHLKKELKDKQIMIEFMEKEQESCKEQIERYEQLSAFVSDFEKRYNNIKEENIKIKEEIIGLINDKKELEEKLFQVNSPEFKRQDLVKTFQEEYKILEDHINSEWEKKTENLKQSLEKEIENKKSLLNKVLNQQFSANKNLLNEYINHCHTALEISTKINIWMEKIMNVNQFINTTEWVVKMNLLQQFIADNQAEYSNLLKKLHSTSIEESEMMEINLALPAIPKSPKMNISEHIQSALNIFYKNQCQVVETLMKVTQSQHPPPQSFPMSHPSTMQQASTTSTYSQYSHPYYHHQYPTIYPPATSTSMPTLGMPPRYPYSQPSFVLPYAQYSQQQYMQQSQEQYLQQTQQQCQQMYENETDQQMYKNEKVPIAEVKVQNEELESVEETTEAESAKLESNEISKSNIKNEYKEEIKNEPECVVEKVDNDNVEDNYTDRIESIRKAFKTIASNVEEKSKVNNAPEDEGSQVVIKQESSNDLTKSNDNVNSQNNGFVKSVPVYTSSANTPVTKSKKKVGLDGLLMMMQKKFPVLETDLIEIIEQIRKKHNNSLTGIPVNQIFRESEEIFLNLQRLHLLRYSMNDGNKSTCSDVPNKLTASNNQSVYTDKISPASSCASLNKADIISTPKKTWKTIPQEETKWTHSGELECSICMAIIKKNNCLTLSCRHAFHSSCIKPWLKSDRSCPNCRVPVTDDDEFPPLPA